MDSVQLQIVELGPLSMRDWGDLVEGERDPFGDTCAGFVFRPKDHHVGIRDGDGRLLAAGGWSLVHVEVDGHGRFPVIGLGALIVRHELRGSGLGGAIMERLRDRIAETGIACRMLLCESHLVELYTRWAYTPIEEPVWVEQPTGPVRWPLHAMWRPNLPGASWPAGTVRVHGLPF